MAKGEDFDAVRARLRAILAPYRSRLVESPIYGIGSIGWPGGSKHDYFAGVASRKAYVSFYFMPVYSHPDLLDGISPALRKRIQGKACFNFATVDEGLLAELSDLVARGFERYEADHAGGRLVEPRSTRTPKRSETATASARRERGRCAKLGPIESEEPDPWPR